MANLAMRLPREQLEDLRAVAEASGSVRSSSTSAVDHAPEVADVEARRSMLTAHRDQLLEIRSRATIVEDLVKIAQELSRVQSEIERLDGRFRVIRDETTTDLLNVSLTTPMSGGRWYAPVLRSISGIPAELASSLGAVVLFLASMLPWMIPLSLVVLLGRRLFRRRRPAPVSGD